MTEETSPESKGQPVKLDLGLSSLLNGGGEEIKAVSSEVGSLSEILKQSVELSQQPPPPTVTQEVAGEFQKLADSGKWQEISKLCEKKLAATRDADKSAKVWWIKSQYETKAIPISILAPGLNLVSREILNTEEIPDSEKEVCKNLLSIFCRNLIANNDHELALLFIGHLFSAGSRTDAVPLLLELETKAQADSAFVNNDQIKAEIKAIKEAQKIDSTTVKKEKFEVEKVTKPQATPEAPQKSKLKYALVLILLLALLPAGKVLGRTPRLCSISAVAVGAVVELGGQALAFLKERK